MKTLERRIVALEGPKRDEYSHLSDEELREKLVETMERLVRGGFVPPNGWREMVASEDPSDFAILHMALREYSDAQFRTQG